MGVIDVDVIVGVGIVGHSLTVDVAHLMLLVEDVVMSLIVFNAENSRHG